jgi:HK97 family phage major capsid protein
MLSTELRRVMTVKADGVLMTQPAPIGGAITPAAGLLSQPHAQGDTLEDNLDALADAIALIESHSGSADLIIASPTSWAAISKMKVGEDSNATLVGPNPAVAAQRQLLSIAVAVSANVDPDLVLVLDRKAVLSAYGPLTLAVSEHAAFRKDNIVTRLTWRFGAVIADENRVVELRVAGVAPAKAAPAKAPAKS